MTASGESPYGPIPDDFPAKTTVYDTTLRDGEQMAGISFSPEAKREIALALDEAGVPQIEVSFPAVSDQEARFAREMVELGLRADTLVLSRCLIKDLDIVRRVEPDMVLLFVAASDLHLAVKLKKTAAEVLESIDSCVRYGVDHGLNISFSTEDSTRARWSTLKSFYETALDAGVTRVGVTDTVGCATPEMVHDLVSRVADLTALAPSLHLHNDYGLALANAIAGLRAGGGYVATTVGGIGERAGNLSLEQFAATAALHYGIETGINLSRLTPLAEIVFSRAGLPLPPNSPLIGGNCFAHESGIHVQGVLADPMTYEPLPPEQVGNERRILLGKHTGRSALRAKLKDHFQLDQRQESELLEWVKDAGEARGWVTDEEALAKAQELASRAST